MITVNPTVETLARHVRKQYEEGDKQGALLSMWRILGAQPKSPISALGFRMARETSDAALADELRRFLIKYGTFNDNATLEWTKTHLALGTDVPLKIEIERLVTGRRSSWIQHVRSSLAGFGVVIGEDLSIEMSHSMPALNQQRSVGKGPNGDYNSIVDRLQSLVVTELSKGARRRSYFLIGLLEQLGSDKEIARMLGSDGLLVNLLELAMSRVGHKLKIRKGFSFEDDLKWAVVTTRRNRLTSLWIEQEGTPSARIVIRLRPTSKKFRQKRSVNPCDAYSVGEIRWVQMEEVSRGRTSELYHPAVFVEKDGPNKWRVITMTTEMEGSPDGRRVPRAEEQGIRYGGFVWHEVQKVFVAEIGDHIGWVHPDLVEVIRRSVSIRKAVIQALSAVAREKYPESGAR
jgi:hypothetical protein